MAVVEAVLLLVAACIGFALLARRLRLPYAVILVLGGMALAFVPGLPRVAFDPELALAFFLPPLLQASAFRTDWRAFRRDLRPILLLAVGGVAFTALCIAAVAKLLVPELPGRRRSRSAPSSRRPTRSPPARCGNGCACRAGW